MPLLYVQIQTFVCFVNSTTFFVSFFSPSLKPVCVLYTFAIVTISSLFKTFSSAFMFSCLKLFILSSFFISFSLHTSRFNFPFSFFSIDVSS